MIYKVELWIETLLELVPSIEIASMKEVGGGRGWGGGGGFVPGYSRTSNAILLAVPVLSATKIVLE